MTARTASLGMYDRQEIRSANDGLWAAIAGRLADAGMASMPPALDRGRPLASIWDDGSLLLAHCCGYPLVTTWRDRLRYVATPRYRVPGCAGSDYRSRIVVRADDDAERLSSLRHRRAAINERTSNSGMNLFRAAIAPVAGGLPFFSEVIETGSHGESARRVAEGEADIAAIDAVSFAHIERHEPATAVRLRTLGWTEPAPGLPLVTSVATMAAEVDALRRALFDVAADPALADVRDALRLDGFDVLEPGRYEMLLDIEKQASGLGYPVLA